MEIEKGIRSGCMIRKGVVVEIVNKAKINIRSNKCL